MNKAEFDKKWANKWVIAHLPDQTGMFKVIGFMDVSNRLIITNGRGNRIISANKVEVVENDRLRSKKRNNPEL